MKRPRRRPRRSAAPISLLRRRRRLSLLGAIILLALLIYADHRGLLVAPPAADFSTYDNAQAGVARVIDGDTIELALPDARENRDTTRVRLWGIDCPELATSQHPAEAWAEDAAVLARRLAQDRTVRLQVEPQRLRDKYGRVLAHVILPDGSNLSEALLLEGLARADDRWSHTLLGRYEQCEQAARRRRAGMWSNPESP